jgi:hypothetical protein
MRICQLLVCSLPCGTPEVRAENAARRQAPMSLEQLTERFKTGQPVTFATFGDNITWRVVRCLPAVPRRLLYEFEGQR